MEGYDGYKESGEDILGEIPSDWAANRLKNVSLIESSGIWGSDNEFKEAILVKVPTTGALTGDGDWIIDKMSDRWLSVSEASYYNCQEGDTIVVKSSGSAANIISGKAGYIDKDLAGSFSFGNFLFRVRPTNINAKFLYYFLISGTTKGRIERMVSTTTYPNIKIPEYVNGIVPIPSSKEQTAIANYLDQQTQKIDRAIAQKERLIELLKERRQIIVQRAVTRGLDASVAMKDSGVEWIGEMPGHWAVKKLKYVLVERKERSESGEETLFMVSQVHGLVIRSEYHDKAEVAASNIGNKIVCKNDLVFNKLKAHLGVFFKSTIDEAGLVSPDYAVYSSLGLIDDLKFLELLFRHPNYIGQFIVRATGIVEGLIRLYTGDLFDIEIPVPSKTEQREILDYVETVSTKTTRAIHQQTQQIAKLKEYRTVLIDAAVTGKIRVG